MENNNNNDKYDYYINKDFNDKEDLKEYRKLFYDIELNFPENIIKNLHLFKFFNKTRRFPSKNNFGGFISTLFMFTIFTFIYFLCNLNLIYIFSNKKYYYIITFIIILITLIITLLFFFDVSTSIPGYQNGENVKEEDYNSVIYSQTIGNKTYQLKYCKTCKKIRDIRTHHCNRCNICVEKHDHHCDFVSNCIGKKNYVKFFIFIHISTIHLLLVEIFSLKIIIVISKYKKDEIKDGKKELVNAIYAFCIINIFIIGFFLCFLLSLIVQHCFNISKNETTREIIKKYEINNFNKGCLENWKEVFCDKEDTLDIIIINEKNNN
jgi:ferredoxin